MSTTNIKNPTDWANAFLGALGEPDTKTNVQNIVGWENSEGGNWHNPDKYNPLDTTQPEPGAVSTNSVGVKAYTSWQQGLDATVQTISAGDYGYPGILDALSKSEPWTQFTQAVAASSWGGAGNKYLEQFATPPGASSSNTPNSTTYNTGSSATTATDNAPNNIASTNNPQKLTGMAGILQSLDQMYNPDITGNKILGFIPNIPSDIEHVSIEIFTRATSAILMLGIVAIGIHTLVSGSSSGGSGSNQSVIEFVNNAQIQNRKLGLREENIKTQEQREVRLSDRFNTNAEVKKAQEAGRNTRHYHQTIARQKIAKKKNKRSKEWADIQRGYLNIKQEASNA